MATQDQRSGRDQFTARHQRAGPDDAPGTDFRAVENDGPHADEHFISHGTGVDDRLVADRHVLADRGRILAVQMNDGAILNVGSCANDDSIDVAAQDGLEPHAAFLTKRDIADDGCVGSDEGAGGDLRDFAPEVPLEFPV